MKKKSATEKYMYVVTKKPLFFYCFLCFGIALFLFLTLTTKIETADGARSLLYVIFVKAGKGL